MAFPVGERLKTKELAAYKKAHPQDKRILGLSGDVVADMTADIPLSPSGKHVLGGIAPHFTNRIGVVSREGMKVVQKYIRLARSNKPGSK